MQIVVARLWIFFLYPSDIFEWKHYLQLFHTLNIFWL